MGVIEKVEICLANTFCAIRDAKCLGKDTSKLEDKLNKLFLAQWILGCGGETCDIDCFINKNCNC